MSFFEDASLVLIPSAQKTSKVYSVKPTDGTGDLTFTRSNDTATRVGPDGLIEKVRTNLVLQSEALNTTWTDFGTGTTVTPNATTAPDGTLTADLVNFPTAAGATQYVLAQNLTLSIGVPHTISFYAKAVTGTITNLVVRINGAEVSLGETITTTWQRFSKVITPITATSDSGFKNRPSVSGSGAAIDVYIWGVQIETGDIATDYIATTSAAVSVGPVANVPRLDYLGSTCGKLILEPQRTNAQTYSEDFSQGKYTKTDCTISSNVTATVDPAGYNGSDKLVEAVTVGGQHYVFFSSQTGANQETQISIFAKAAGRTEFLLWESAITNAQARFNLSNGTISDSSSGNVANLVTTTPTITSYGNGWYRCTLNFKTALGGGTIRVQLYNGSTSYNGNGTDGIYIYGLQEEVNTAYATSYIPTLGAAVTRGADFPVNLPTAISLSGDFSLFWEGTAFETDLMLYGSGNSTWYMNILGSAGRVILDTNTGRKVQGTIASLVVGTKAKVLIRRQSGAHNIFVNGVKLINQVSVNDTTTLSLSSMFWGFSSTFYKGQTVNQSLIFQTALSDADCIALTA